MPRLNVGVDIGSTSIKAVQIKISGKKVTVVKAAEIPLKVGVVVAGEIKDIEELSNAINELWKVGKFTTKNVTVGLANQQILVRELVLPWEPAKIFKDALPIRIGDAFSRSPSELILDYYPIDIYSSGDLIQQKSLVVGAYLQAAENAAEALTLSKLRVKKADFSPFALIRASMVNNSKGIKLKPNTGKPYEVLIDVGGQITLIAIHEQGKPLYVRIIPAGADAVTRALSEQLKIRFDVAEVLKKSIGLQEVGGEQIKSPIPQDVPDESIPDAQHIINSMAGHLVQEVRKTIEYFLSLVQDSDGIERILLSGGGSLIPGYAQRIASELRIPTTFLAPMNTFAKNKDIKTKDPNMSLAFGLALEVK